MEITNILNQILILFLIMGVGVAACKLKFISNETNVGLSKILLNVTLPLLIISSFTMDFSKDMLKTAGIIFLISMIVHGSLVVISKFMYKKQPESVRSVLRFVTIFSNCGYIGYPVAASIYGSEGVFYAAVYNIAFNIFMWTIGILIFQPSKEKGMFKKAIFNPGMISIAVGMIIFIFSIKLPYALDETIKLVGNMTTPLSMIIVGVSLCSVSLKEAFKEFIYYKVSFIRLILIPIVVYLCLKFLGFEGIYIGIPIIVSAMPAAANTVTLAQIYKGDVDSASKIIVVSTIFSAITLPLMLLLI